MTPSPSGVLGSWLGGGVWWWWRRCGGGGGGVVVMHEGEGRGVVVKAVWSGT